jgi:hypothetical protein
MTENVFDRDKLYKEVWDEPMTKVAPKYGMCDRNLKKHCVKLKIPTPGVGYWQKIEAGAIIKKPRLPKYNGPPVVYYCNPEVYEERQKEKERHQQEKEKYQQEIEKVKVELTRKDRKHSIKVLEQLKSPHPFVEQLYKDMKKEWASPYKQYYPVCSFYRGMLSIKVSKNSALRALCIMDAIIKALIAEGYIKEELGRTYVMIDNEKIYFELREGMKQLPHVKTAKEKQDEKTSIYSYTRTYDYLPTGKFKLSIENDCYLRRRNWIDMPERRLEDCLSDFIDGLVFAAARSKIDREKRLVEERRRLEEERRRQEAAEQRRIQEELQKELRAKEIEKFEKLKRQAADWQLARRLKEYIDAMESSLNDSLPEEELAIQREYVAWARKKIAWLNPLVGKGDDIFGYRKS